MDTNIVRNDGPEILADEPPHGCYEGWVFIGHVVELPDGSEEVVHVPVPCKRCKQGEERR